MSVGDMVKAYRIAERVLKGEGGAVAWNAGVREGYLKWLKGKGVSGEHAADCVRYLNRYVTSIEKPEDVVEVFSRCQRGKPHLAKALRSLIRYHVEVKGLPDEEAERLLATVPKTRSSVDYREASLEDVARTMEVVRSHDKYYLVYRLVLDGGIRLAHAVQLLQTYQPERLTRLGGFARYSLGLEKEVKHTWYAYMRLSTADMLKPGVKITKVAVFRFLAKKKPENIVTPKLVRKFAFNSMIKCGMPESVADFICGRKPATVGARHYLWVRSQADQWYPRYAKFLDRAL